MGQHRNKLRRLMPDDEVTRRIQNLVEERRNLILPTIRAIEVLEEDPADTNAIIHATC
jgi:hypothetical protein